MSSESSAAGSTSTTSTEASGPKLGPIGLKGPMIGADGGEFSASGEGLEITPQPATAEAATELAVGGADIGGSVRQKVHSALAPKVGELSHEDLLGARAGALKDEMSQQSAKIMDASAEVGMPAPPMLKIADLHAWRAERQAAATQDAGHEATVRQSGPYPDPFAFPTPKMN